MWCRVLMFMWDHGLRLDTPPPRPLLRLGIVPRASAGLLTRLFMETCTGGAQGPSSPRELIQALPQEPPPHPQPLVTNAASGV